MNNRNNIHILATAILRRGECMLLYKTHKLLINFYFLSDAYIEAGESVEAALQREMIEIGIVYLIKKSLGCLKYQFEVTYLKICHN